MEGEPAVTAEPLLVVPNVVPQLVGARLVLQAFSQELSPRLGILRVIHREQASDVLGAEYPGADLRCQVVDFRLITLPCKLPELIEERDDVLAGSRSGSIRSASMSMKPLP